VWSSFLAVDLAGNTQLVPTNLSWVVDQTLPRVWPILLPSLLNNLVTFNMSFMWSEELAGLWASTDRNVFQAVPMPTAGRAVTLLVNGTADGTHTIAVKGISMCASYAFFTLVVLSLSMCASCVFFTRRKRYCGQCHGELDVFRVDARYTATLELQRVHAVSASQQ
jgi:hypothetical protein